MSNQLEDNGAVIGYRPNLEYKKEMNKKTEVSAEENASTDSSGNVQYSDTLTGFNNNTPSNSIKDVDYVIENIKTLIDELSKSFTNGNWNEYNDISVLLGAVEVNNSEEIVNFINYHKNLITGSIVPELIGLLHDTKVRLETLNHVLKELYYGTSSIGQEEAEEIDKSYLDQLKKSEVSGQTRKINYLALSYDSILNRSVTMYAYGVNRKAIGLSKIVQSETEITSDSSKKQILNSLYNKTNRDIECRLNAYEVQQNIEIMKKTLYNYYEKRSAMIDLYDMYSDNPEFPLMNRLYEYQEIAEKAIENVARTFIGNQYHLGELTNLEQEKYDLMNNYSKLNYNF